MAALAADECVRASLQVSRNFGLGHGLMAAPYVYVDSGWLWHLGAPSVGQQSFQEARSLGLGMDLHFHDNLVLNTVVAFPMTTGTTTLETAPYTQTLRDRSPSIFFNLGFRQ